jgi:PAS domain S-box-containing protein
VIDWFLLPRLHHWSDATGVDMGLWLAFVVAGIVISILFEGQYRTRVESLASNRLRDVTLASICDAVITTDPGGNVTFLNGEAERLTGWTNLQAVGRPLSDILNVIDEHTREPADNPVTAVLRSGVSTPPTNHSTLVSRNGSRVPVSKSAAPIKSPGGQIEGIVLVFRDVSASQTATAELEKRIQLQEQLAHIVANTPAAIYSFRKGPDGAISFPYASPAFEATFGTPVKDLLLDGTIVFSHVYPDDLPHLLATVEESARTMKPWECEFRVTRKDQDPLWLDGRAVPRREANGGILWFGCIRDTTERKQSELHLSESQRSLQLALDAGRLGVWSHDFTTNKFAADARTQELFGFAPLEEFGFAQFLEVVTSDTRDAFIESLERQRQGDAGDLAVDFRITLPGGRDRWISVRAIASRSAEGELFRLDGLCMDISEQRNAEARIRSLEGQYRHAQKMEAVGRLAGGVAHDFNNLLMVIQGYTEMLQDDMPDDYLGKKYAQQILTAGARAAGLTRQLLAFSRKQVLCPVSLNLNQVIEETSKMTKRLLGEDIEVSLDLEPSLWSIMADADQMSQVLMNLAVNSRDAMPEGGILAISTKNVRVKFGGREEHGWVNAGDYVAMIVTDTGIGMSETVQQHLFEPFYTTKETGKGTGLGLATVYGIVQQSGGYVWAKSELGRGSSFIIYIPSTKTFALKQSSDAIDNNPRGTETLLVVEDDKDLQQTLVAFLAGRGYAVLAASTPQEALSIARQYALSIELLITDVVMPGMRGPRLAREIRKHRPQIKTIYMSGYVEDSASRDDIMRHDTPFLQKPVRLHSLAVKVREVIAPIEFRNCGGVLPETTARPD